MKIAMLAPLPPPSGGIASWTVRFRDYCNKNSIPLRIVNIAMIGNRATVEDMNVKISDEIRRTSKILSDLKRTIKDFKPDVLHLNTSCSRFGVIRDALCMARSFKKVPVIVHCRCNIEDQLRGRIAHLAFRYLVRKASRIIVLNRFSKEFVDRIASGKATFIPLFIDKSSFEEHAIRPVVQKVVYVGHVEKSKGLVEILETAKNNPELEFKLVGAIRDDISQFVIPENVELTGRLDHDGVTRCLKEADLFLFPSKTEGFSNSVLEAMAEGLPIIASDVGANREMLEESGGIILNANNTEAIQQAISELLTFERRKKCSQWNINKVKKDYIIEKVIPKYFSTYSDVIVNTNQ